MKRINTGYVSDPTIQQPLTTKSLDFLQNNTSEMVFAICQGLIKKSGYTYSTSTPYLISLNSNTGFTSDGVVFYNGELYIMTENVASLQYAVIDTTPDAVADPVMFSDSVNRNVHNNRYLTFQSSATGALFDVNNIVNIYNNNPFVSITTASTGDYTIPSTVQSQPNDLQLRLNRFSNEVEFRGFVTKGSASGAPSILIYTLPVGQRPINIKQFVVPAINGSGVYGDNYNIFVFPNGSVSCQPPNNTTLSLDSIRFSLD